MRTTHALRPLQCGGAQTRTRPSTLKRRRRQPARASNRTGPQTMKKRKPGTRVRSKGAFAGSTGRALNEDMEDEELKKVGTGFRKQAGRYAKVGIATRSSGGS